MKTSDKLLVQCDFDGTVTLQDASFAILDAYIPGKWRPLFERYQHGDMTVGEFNTQAFAMVAAGKDALLRLVSEVVAVRDGFKDFVEYCRNSGYEFVIVSNGLDFYIEHILKEQGFTDIRFFASITEFSPSGLTVGHKGPDGASLDRDVKTAYTDYYIGKGYRVVYLGDGLSDLSPARKCARVFATGSLVEHCRNAGLECTPFNTFYEVMSVMESRE